MENSKDQTPIKKLISKIPAKQRKVTLAVLLVVIAVIIFICWKYFSSFQSTDDAFIEGHIIKISPKVSGYVEQLLVNDNMAVKKGDLLLVIEPQDYETRVEQLKAKLEIAKNKNLNNHSTIVTAQKQIEQTESMILESTEGLKAANADLNLAQISYDRVSRLYEKGAASKQKYDEAQAKLETAKAQQRAATERVEKAKIAFQASSAQKTTVKSSIDEAAALYKQANLDLSYTKIYTPVDGVITSRAVEEGAFVQRGQSLFAIVPSERWIVANFKETQLTHMKSGQAVKIKVDAFPDVKFTGKVDSIQNATGSKTSLFPPENAVGSYVKIVQRVPVKIIFDNDNYKNYPIQPGMSVVPRVRVK